MQRLHLVLANGILIFHALLVLYNVCALPIIWIGYFRRWNFVRNFAFRISHLVLIGFVAAEALFGALCPLTTWEDELRKLAGTGARYEDGYVAYWIHRFLFYDLDPKFFMAAYLLFFALVLVTWFAVKPRRRRAQQC
jgi:hypothetical protein